VDYQCSNSRADLIIIDLEDAVPSGRNGRGQRDSVADAILTVHDNGQRIFIRINGHPNSSADRTARDLEEIVPQEPDGLVVPKGRNRR